MWTFISHFLHLIFLPFSQSTAQAFNFTSSFYNSVATYFLYITSKRFEISENFTYYSRWTNDNFSSALATLWLAFSSTFWNLSISTNTHTLDALLLSIILYLSSRNDLKWSIYSVSFVSGLLVTNNPYQLNILLPTIFYFAQTQTSQSYIQNVMNVTKMALSFIIGLSPLALLMILHSGKPFSWGSLTTISSLKSYLFESDYGTLRR